MAIAHSLHDTDHLIQAYQVGTNSLVTMLDHHFPGGDVQIVSTRVIGLSHSIWNSMFGCLNPPHMPAAELRSTLDNHGNYAQMWYNVPLNQQQSDDISPHALNIFRTSCLARNGISNVMYKEKGLAAERVLNAQLRRWYMTNAILKARAYQIGPDSPN